jgi:gluconolactonase
MEKLRLLSFLLTAAIIVACEGEQKENPDAIIGSIERFDEELKEVIPEGAVIQILAEGFDWSEGPIWISEGNYLIFSDIPPNRIYKWSEKDSIELYLEPSGYTGDISRGGEEGSNGLLLNQDGSLVLCQHGDRRMAKMDAPLSDPKPVFTTLIDNYEGKRLNSPNDACYDSKGNLYFTDPPYGLPDNVNDPAKELDFQGVYMLSAEGSLVLLTKDLSRPNGIAFSPDERTLYVANSDPEKAIWMSYDVSTDGILENGRVFFDVTDRVGKEKGLPDGMKVNKNGYIFATGPGGVLIFNPDGKHLGTIRTTQATANCAFNESEDELYITADMYLLRVDLKAGI